MSERDGAEGDGGAEENGRADGDGAAKGSEGGQRSDRGGASLTTAVRRRRGDQAFFLRLRDAIHQNHRALERLGT